ncbi:YsnF/AvaK domain-containing protein [Neobacillus drentensis]|uniref:YsnF/AvaK domain-containing protein n=1 Tax=Neobacillus drentensis TaxID=220684 RepID=UPI002FFD6920
MHFTLTISKNKKASAINANALLNPESTTDTILETIRIPLSEERIEVTKHPIILEDVEIFKNKIEEHIQFNETLKEEKLHIDTVGDIR